LWLDGGHNDSAGEVLASQAAVWKKTDDLPLYLITGMLTTKNPIEFLSPLVPFATALCAVPIPDEALAFRADTFAARARDAGIKNTESCSDVSVALRSVTKNKTQGRILICGSLYLAGHVLKQNLEK